MSETTEKKSLNLDKKLFDLRKYVDVVQKTEEGYGYSYTSIVEILAKLKAGMDKKKLLLEPIYTPGSQKVTIDHYEKTKTKRDKSGNETTTTELVHEFIVQQEMVWRWTDIETGETKEIPWSAIGEQSDPSQAQGGALTYAQRQFLTQYFQIATPKDDPDYYLSKKEEAEADAELAMVAQIVTKIDAYVSSYLDANGNSDDARKKIAAEIRKYVVDENGKPTAKYADNLTDTDSANKVLNAVMKMSTETKSTPAKTAKKDGGK